MDFLQEQLDKKAIPVIKPGMLQDLIIFIQRDRQEVDAELMAKRFARIVEQAGKDEPLESQTLVEKIQNDGVINE